LGSFFAGIKAGTLGGILYIGGLSFFDAALLYAFKPDALIRISQNLPQICPSINSTSIEACFNSVIVVYLPYTAFLGFFVSLFFAGFFGWGYESFPGRRPLIKGEAIAIIVALALVLGDLTGIYLGPLPTELLATFFVAWTVLYGFVMGNLYSRYTRVVRFESSDDRLVKVLLDGRNYTGKSRTIAHNSAHKIRAEVDEGASFKGWIVGGGVTIEDPRSFETIMEVNGDGSLKAMGAKKY